MKKWFKKQYYKRFATYKRLEVQLVPYNVGDNMLRDSEGKPEDQQWHLAKEEDTNRAYGYVFLERKVRIWE